MADAVVLLAPVEVVLGIMRPTFEVLRGRAGVPSRGMTVAVCVPTVRVHVGVVATTLMARLAALQPAGGCKDRQQAQQKQASS